MPTIKHSLSMSSLSSEKDGTLMNLTQSHGARRTSLVPQSYLPVKDEETKNHGGQDKKVGVGKSGGNMRKKRRRRRNLVTANLTGTRYEVIRNVVEDAGFTITKDDDPNSYLLWNDCFVSTEKIAELKPYQRINHFPGMGEVTRKDALARNIMRMQKQHPDEYSFVPRTWILPTDYTLLQNHAKDQRAKKKVKTFIVKPSNGAQGHGIQLFRSAEKILPTDHYIVQEYIDKPLLLDGFKFDLRIYVLVTSCDPLRIFLFNDGLVRLGTEKYLPPHESNINHLYMHLTNYSVNKHNEFYEKSSTIDSGSKRSIKYLNDYLRRNDIDVALLWKNIADMIVKTLILAEPHVLHAYRMCRPGSSASCESVCFEVLGFDVVIDRKLRPWLLEINRSPSFGTDETLDYDIKSALLEDTLRLLNIKVSDKRKNIAALKAEAQRRLFRSSKKLDAGDISDVEKKRQSIERKKEELKELLTRIRKTTAREDFENQNCGRFRRIFPCEDKMRQERYCLLLTSAFSLFLSGHGSSMSREIDRTYKNKLREEDVLDMLTECEANERDDKAFISSFRGPYGPKPLQSMPESGPPPAAYDDEDGSENSTPSVSPSGHRPVSLTVVAPSSRPQSTGQRVDGCQSLSNAAQTGASRVDSDALMLHARSNISLSPGRSRSHNRTVVKPPIPSQKSAMPNHQLTCQVSVVGDVQPDSSLTPQDDFLLSMMTREHDDELTRKTLWQLNDMRIKFPGKTDQEADVLLDKLHENWKFHKPRIASYWLVKLDSIKRRKVIDIVRSNVKAVVQRIWRSSDVDSLRLFRIFGRIFNRLLWSHGQGLWNCFTTGNTWETIFSKSSESITQLEMNCCRRIVQLCRDCLLIVYQFAAEAKSSTAVQAAEQDDNFSMHAQNEYLHGRELKPPSWNPQTFSQRYSKLYQTSGLGS